MSGTKRALEDIDERRAAAVSFAVSAGTLKRCEYHEEIVYEGDRDLDRLYRAAAAEFKRDPRLFPAFDA